MRRAAQEWQGGKERGRMSSIGQRQRREGSLLLWGKEHRLQDSLPLAPRDGLI